MLTMQNTMVKIISKFKEQAEFKTKLNTHLFRKLYPQITTSKINI